MNNMGLLTGVAVIIPKYLIISIKIGIFATLLPSKMGGKWCILVLRGTIFSKFSANF